MPIPCGASWPASRRGRPVAEPRRAAGRLLPVLALAAAAVLAGACAAGPAPRAAPAGSAPSEPVEPWEIPETALGTQRLFRVSYSGPEGEGSFRLTLRLVSPERYQVQAVDPLGRALWSLDVVGGHGIWLNHRSRSFCRFQGSFDIQGAPLGPFPLPALPSLLLGRVPADPAGPLRSRAEGREVTFPDRQGRSWTVALGEGGEIRTWTLAEGGAPTVWWLRRDDDSILSDRERGIQVRWRQVLREPLEGEPPPLEPPAGFRETLCEEPDLLVPEASVVPEAPAGPPI